MQQVARASRPSSLGDRVWMPEFDSYVAGGELPVGLSIVGVGAMSPSLEFCVEHVDVGDASAQGISCRGRRAPIGGIRFRRTPVTYQRCSALQGERKDDIRRSDLARVKVFDVNLYRDHFILQEQVEEQPLLDDANDDLIRPRQRRTVTLLRELDSVTRGGSLGRAEHEAL